MWFRIKVIFCATFLYVNHFNLSRNTRKSDRCIYLSIRICFLDQYPCTRKSSVWQLSDCHYITKVLSMFLHSVLYKCMYILGINGLTELQSLDEAFEEFETTLFAESSISFERSVQTKEVNEKLNSNIQEFLVRLGPYVLLKPAHKALEWLIYRYMSSQARFGEGVRDYILWGNENLIQCCILSHVLDKWKAFLLYFECCYLM